MMNRYLVVALCSGLLLGACGPGDESGDGLSGEVKIDGSSTVFPITEAIAEEFRSEAPGVRVTVGVSGTGGGFQKFLRGDTDLNDASREIKPAEIELAEKNGIDYIKLSVAYDGLAVVVNPENNWVDHFTTEELEKIWEPDAQENITRWSQIREGWPDRDLHLYGPGVASGTYDYFTKVIVGESGASRGDFTASEDDNVLVQGIATDKYALGFFGIAYFEENAEKLKLVGVDNGDSPVKPTSETVLNGTYAPLSRPLFLYVSEDAARRKPVQDFVRFYLEKAPEVAGEVGYIAMPDSLYQRQKDIFETFINSSGSGQ